MVSPESHTLVFPIWSTEPPHFVLTRSTAAARQGRLAANGHVLMRFVSSF